MDNLPSFDFMKYMKEIFNKATGLDLGTCTDAEFQDWYHEATRAQAKEDPYLREVLKTAERIIEERNYSHLISILRNYDQLVKEKYNTQSTETLPYWCYAFGLRPEEEK